MEKRYVWYLCLVLWLPDDALMKVVLIGFPCILIIILDRFPITLNCFGESSFQSWHYTMEGRKLGRLLVLRIV